jgi:hypothetical protein
MANYGKTRGHRPSKNATPTQARLTDRHRKIASTIAPNMTSGIETALKLVEIAIDAAARGDEDAIALLAQLGVEVLHSKVDVIEVRRSDGSIAAWIV